MAKTEKRITSALGRFSNSTVTNGDDAFKNPNIADYTVPKKVEGSYALRRKLYWVVFFAAIVILVGTFFALGLGLIAVVLGAIIVLIAWIVKYFTWRYFDIQYSYAIENSEFFATEIYGEKADKLLVRIKMNQITRVAPYDGQYKTEADSKTYDKSLFIAKSADSSDLFFLTYKTEDNKEGIVYFDACSKSLKAFKYYNSEIVTFKETSR